MFLVVVFVPGRLPCKFHGDVLVLFQVGYHEGMTGNNTGEVLFLFLLLFLFRVGYHGEIIGHNTRKALFLFLNLVLVPGRSQVIALRGSYSDDCSYSYFCSCSYSLIIRMLFLSAIFPCYCSCSGQVTGDSLSHLTRRHRNTSIRYGHGNPRNQDMRDTLYIYIYIYI
jgi:hypothetical protein